MTSTLKKFSGLLLAGWVLFSTGSAIAQTPSYTRERVIQKLHSLDNSSPIAVVINKDIENSHGSGDDFVSSHGSISVNVNYRSQGLAIDYPRELLERIEQETRAHELDPNLPTPLQNASWGLNTREIQSLIAAHEVLLRRLKTAKLVAQSEVRYNQQESTLLEFDVQPKFSRRDKKYLKKHQAKLKLWLDRQGWPIACETEFTMSGRAFLVVTFAGEETEKIAYQRNGNRLVASYKKTYRSNSGGGESEKNSATIRLTILPLSGQND